VLAVHRSIGMITVIPLYLVTVIAVLVSRMHFEP
jgi:hypothetical protein